MGSNFIEYIHDELVGVLWPEKDPLSANEYKDRGLIDSAAARPFHSVFGTDAYPSILEKAAALFHSINANHAFYNGNKRTSVLAFDIFLVVNGYYSLVSNDDIYKLAEKTASYRERGISHEEAYREIIDAIRPFVITLNTLRREAKLRGGGVEDLYEQVMIARKRIRNQPGNQLIDP